METLGGKNEAIILNSDIYNHEGTYKGYIRLFGKDNVVDLQEYYKAPKLLK